MSLANVVAALFLLTASVLAGLWVRQLRLRAETLQRMGEDRVRAALAEERPRIAPDLHDEVAHAMSVIAVQADAAQGALAHDPSLVLGSGRLALYAVAFWAIMATFVNLYEEPVLTQRYGGRYRTYRDSVPGWIPRLRPWRSVSSSG